MDEMTRALVILKVGEPVDAVLERRGDFPSWISEKTGVVPGAFTVIDPRKGEALPAIENVDAVIVSGSSAMVSDRAAWSVRTGEWLKAAVEAGVPTLGICYGHQLLAQALGGEVGRNPRGREIGTIDVDLSEEGRSNRLFTDVPPRFQIHATHVEVVLRLPPGARVLASNSMDAHQAFAIGPAWGVQFHPEFDADIIRGYVHARREILANEGIDAATLSAAIQESDAGRTILRNFMSVARARNASGSSEQ